VRCRFCLNHGQTGDCGIGVPTSCLLTARNPEETAERLAERMGLFTSTEAQHSGLPHAFPSLKSETWVTLISDVAYPPSESYASSFLQPWI